MTEINAQKLIVGDKVILLQSSGADGNVYTDIGISPTRFAELLSRDAYCPTLDSAPTSSTTQYTEQVIQPDDTVTTEPSTFRPGQLARVADSSVEGGYVFYRCCDVQYDTDGTTPVSASWQLAKPKIWIDTDGNIQVQTRI